MRRKPNHDELDRLNTAEDDIRKLKLALLQSGGFAPISAAVYDGYSGSDPIAERGEVTYTIADAGVSGDTGQVSQESGTQIPPSYANNWLRYVWYDDGFSASAGTFTVPQDGVYAVHGRLAFSVLNGQVDDCNLILTKTGGLDVAFTDGPRDVVPGDADVALNASGQVFLASGEVVRMGFTINMSGLTGLSSGTNLIWVTRTSRTNAPPTDSASPAHDARFSITKISDTTP